MRIPEGHPRRESLLLRERLVEGFRNGLVVEEGLMAHGRGEALDYILGERTHPFALRAVEAASAAFRSARHPVISVNGNAAALCARELVEMALVYNAKLEVNLFYRTEERVRRLVEHLHSFGAAEVLGAEPDARIPGLDGPRGLCSSEGIYRADVVFLSLEDGDRTEALRRAGKTVISVDLNPMSRTARMSHITIVDNLVRALPRLIECRAEASEGYSNSEVLAQAMEAIRENLSRLQELHDPGEDLR